MKFYFFVCDAYIVQIGRQIWVFVNWEEGWTNFHPLTKGYINLHIRIMWFFIHQQESYDVAFGPLGH
jgi:hypothetical protein